MKVLIAYPPLNKTKGTPTLGQNRQFQYLREPAHIYPVVPASAATLLKNSSHEVIWMDCIAENISFPRFLSLLEKEKPDLIAFEAKTPVIQELWAIIDAVKKRGIHSRFVLFGDHVTVLPQESFQMSQVDFILTGGDYDFLLLNLCDYLLSQRHPANGHRVELESGIWYRDNFKVKNTGVFKLNHDLDSLPFIDRNLTRWKNYAFRNGNYKRVPGTYIMSGRDCWWGKCSFCSWPVLYPDFRLRSVENVLNEIGFLIQKYRVREIMDDTGCFPVGDWLRDFTSGSIARGYNKRIYFDCNMRFGALNREDFVLMKKANFRLLLFGLESANQNTLDRINKNLKVERVIEDCKEAKRAGLFPHITVMFGYPWETYEEALRTFNLGRWLLKKGFAFTMQATIVMPYPGSPLFDECKRSGLLRTLNWSDFDMKQPVIKTSIPDEKIMRLVQNMYKLTLDPLFILKRIASFRDIDDLFYALRASRKVAGHIFDFMK